MNTLALNTQTEAPQSQPLLKRLGTFLYGDKKRTNLLIIALFGGMIAMKIAEALLVVPACGV